MVSMCAWPLNKLEPQLDQEFQEFYNTNISFTPTGKPLVNLKTKISSTFITKSVNFFAKNQKTPSKIDKYFNNFHDIWRFLLDMGQFKIAERLWHDVLEFVLEWENSKPKIHKGTPYYWFAGTEILNGELEKGFIHMHQALEEDIKRHNTANPQTPAFFFVTLDYEQTKQYFQQIVRNASDFLDLKIDGYFIYMWNRRPSNLNLTSFKSKFLEQTGTLLESIFYFVYSLFKMKQLLNIKQELRQNPFSSLVEMDLIFGLCLVVEEIIKQKDTTSYLSNNPVYFSNRIAFLSEKTDLSIHDINNRAPNRGWKPKRPITQDCSGSRLAGTLSALLGSTYPHTSGIEDDLVLSYALRNFAAHSIASLQLVYEEFETIVQRVLNALFFSIESLY